MARGVRKYLVGSVVFVLLIAIAGCSHFMLAEREPWRHDAEVACLNSGAVKESPTRVRIPAINGPGMCGADYPLRVSTLGDSGPLGYDDEPLRPPSTIPDTGLPKHWPIVQSNALPPPATSPPDTFTPAPPPSYRPPPPSTYGAAADTFTPAPPPNYQPPPAIAPPHQPSPIYGQDPYRQPQYPQPLYGAVAPGAPLSINPPGLEPDDDEDALPPAPPGPTYTSPNGVVPPLGPPSGPPVTGSTMPVGVNPPATLACPIVSMLDQWISTQVQPAAQKWFRQPVVEIKQISAYSCRGMNGNPNAHISEHAFGNALDIAEFTLADGRRVSVQYGWHGTPEEQAFLHDVQAAACQDFTTVLAPGANVYHYNHIHVDLMRHYNGRHICEPTAIPGDVVAERARGRYAAQHAADLNVTGSIEARARRRPLGYSDDDRRPLAVPGDD